MLSLQVTSVTRTFGSFAAVSGVSFSLAPGKVVGLLGANGAGKTTSLRLLAGELLPSSGDVVLGDFSTTKHTKQYQRLVGFLPESNPLYQELLVVELLSYSRDLYQIPKALFESQLRWLVPNLGLESVYTTPIKRLSKGYRQRVGLAAALLHDPLVVLLDEPTEGLDPVQRLALHGVLRELAKKKIVVLSTHMLQEASRICDRMLVLNQGSLVADTDSQKEKSSKPVFTAELEGKGVLRTLRQSSITVVSSKRLNGDRYLLSLHTAQTKRTVPQLLSALVAQHGWTVWSLSNAATDSLEELYANAIQAKKEVSETS